VTQLQHQVSLLQKMIFGPKSDRFKLPTEVPANQLSLGMSVDTVAEVEVKKTTVKEHDRTKVKIEPKKHPGRHALPSNLRREEIIIEPQEDVTDCTRLEDEVTEVLEVNPEFYVKRYVRRKYIRKDGEGIAMGKLPNRTIEKGIPGASVLAMLIIGKFVDHLPIYRQIAIFKRAGLNLHYNTVLDWNTQGLDALTPLYELLKRKILSSIYLQADETGIKVLDSEKKGSSHQGFLWAYRDVIRNLVMFEYQRGHNKEGPAKMLKSFQGFLQTDGYAAYDQLLGGKVYVCFIAWRMLDAISKEAEDNDKQRSAYALLAFQELYELERLLKDLPVEEKYKRRQEVAASKLAELHKWMIEQYTLVTPKSHRQGVRIFYEAMERTNPIHLRWPS